LIATDDSKVKVETRLCTDEENDGGGSGEEDENNDEIAFGGVAMGVGEGLSRILDL
jgi:hypothetical protein